jgi:hypothetical protein
MFVIYLVALGLCTWFGPKVSAVLDSYNVEKESTNRDAFVAFTIGLIPVFNIFFVFFGAWLLTDILRVMKESKNGNTEAVKEFNKKLKELFPEQ